MNTYVRIAALGLAIACATSCDRTPPTSARPQPPVEIVAAVNVALAEYGESSAPAAPWPEGTAQVVAISPDGIADWLIDFEAFGFPAWCGTGGCRRQLWVSHGDHHVLAFDAQALSLAVRAGGPPVIDVELHGVFCNGTGADACPRAFAWNAATGWLDEVADRAGSKLLNGPLFQPVPVDEAALPPPLTAARDSGRRSCAAAGGRYEEFDSPFASVPDLDGDGRRDWLLDGSLTACETGAGTPRIAPVRVFLSGGGVHEAAPLASGEYDIDIGSSPARVLPRVPGHAH